MTNLDLAQSALADVQSAQDDLASAEQDLTALIAGLAPPPPGLSVTQTITEGQVLSTPLEWSALPSASVSKIEFLIDGVLKWTEGVSPYVFNGDGNKLDPQTLSAGAHVLSVKAYGPTTATASANVTVQSTAPPATGGEGRVQFCMYATSQADKYTLSPAPSQPQKDWMNQHWNRAIIYMDQIGSWKVGDWLYLDAMAIYTSSGLVSSHPEWILKNASGTRLTFYSSVQYAADIGNPAFQDYMAQVVAGMPGRGYDGVHLDDVNLDRVVVPTAINPRTNAVYTFNDWRRDFANYMEKVRAAAKKAKPDFTIVHNALWWSDRSNADVVRQVKACDVYELERGFNDANYTPQKIVQVWEFVDWLHSLGVAANHLSEAAGKQAATFNLGCALMCSNGKDFLYGDGWRPDGWDPMYDLDLGSAKGARRSTGTYTWARDFEKATVTVDLQAKTAGVPAGRSRHAPPGLFYS